jgi:hypothetical protein
MTGTRVLRRIDRSEPLFAVAKAAELLDCADGRPVDPRRSAQPRQRKSEQKYKGHGPAEADRSKPTQRWLIPPAHTGILRFDSRTPRDRPHQFTAAQRIAEGTRNIEFFAGWLLWKHGRREEGRGFLERSSKLPHTMEWFRLIASDTLRGPQYGPERVVVDPQSTS